ncbi:ABC transporter ATP-binding protein [Pistricoccus aurantiacus]|uniref:ABC transporter ATP-binding protein n=1 Tax=Pistricoccus aurantiacus TaxID=1883414 RepID=UPI0036426272
MADSRKQIELDGVTKRFGNETAVEDITLSIDQGELCVLVGTSGCGKSTTLRMINRLIEHSSGQIRIDGEQIRSFNPQTLRRRIGYAIQSTGLFPHWNVARNIGVVPRLLKWPKARIDDRVSELMKLLALDESEFAEKFPHQLSGGQAQRVGVARALAADPEILLMDEPFGALDPITRETLQNELLHLQEQIRKTIVFVTHDMDEALKLADRIVVMHQGRIVQQDTPKRLLQHPEDDFVESLFGGQDRGLKKAGLIRVSSVMRAPEARDTRTAEASISVAPDDNLRQALSLMLWYRLNFIGVVDANRKRVGVLMLEDILTGEIA